MERSLELTPISRPEDAYKDYHKKIFPLFYPDHGTPGGRHRTPAVLFPKVTGTTP
jgi:hypothetical protein